MELTAGEGWADEVPGWLARGLVVDFEDSDAGPSVAEVLVQVAALEPGGEAISLLASVAGRTLSEDEKLTVVALWQPLLAWACAQEVAAVADLAGPEPVPGPAVDEVFSVDELIAYELAPALGISIGAARTRLRRSRLLAPGGQFARTGALARAGQLSDYQTRILLGELEGVEPGIAATVEGQALAKAGSVTPTQLTRLIRRAVKKAHAKADPQARLREFIAARTTRRVEINGEAFDGLVAMTAWLPPVEAIAIHRHLQAAAGGRDGFDGRCQDERIADALTAAVLGSTPGEPTTPLTPNITLQVLIDAATLFGLRNHPGELLGYGDLPAELVRALAGDAHWQRLVIDPIDGHLLDLGKHRYRPDRALADYIRARDRFCRFPFSTRPAEDCDLDHGEAFDRTGTGNGGSTSAANLAALSRPPHRAKTHAGHTITHLGNGIIRWQTPLGRSYTTHPHDYRPDPDDDPPDTG